jgi:hypothetical protein
LTHSSIPGPRKLILIDSGVYPYAEIELEGSVHLSGRNNAGKTSLLNTLQFLYIDDIKLMHFPNSNFQGKTKPFYFKAHGRSSILLEADTRWGIRTVGFHGLGAASGCDWQRFGFDGPYAKDDFVDAITHQPRPWPEVKARLALKNYVELSQAQLRSALRGGAGERSGFRLELVPGGGSYDTFIEVFRQLLTLRRSKAEDLKNLLISVVEPELSSGDERGRGTVALGSVVGEAYQKAHADTLRYENIRKAEKSCLHLFADHDRYLALQAGLPGALGGVYREARARFTDRRTRADEAREAAEEAREAERVWSSRRRDLDLEIKGKDQELGKVNGRLEAALEMRDQLDAEPRALQEARLADLREEAGRVRLDLSAFQGAGDPSSALRARISKHRQERLTLMDTIARLLDIDAPRAAWMEVLEEYPDEERDPLLRLINPAILSLPDGAQGVEVVTPAELGRTVSRVFAAAQGGVFQGSGVRIHLAALPAPALAMEDPLVRARDIEGYETRVAHLDQELKRLEAMAEDSRAREGLLEKLKTLDAEETTLAQLLSRIGAWAEEAAKIPDLETRAGILEAETARLGDAREEALAEHEASRTRARVEENRAAALQREATELQERILRDLDQRAQALGLDLGEDEAGLPALGDAEFAAAQAQLNQAWDESIRLDQALARKMEEIELQLDGMIAGDRAAKVDQLRDLIEGLPGQKAQLDADWQHIAVTARTSFTLLLRDFETLQARVARLNRSMGKFAVSNLSGAQLRLVENTARLTVLRRFTQDEGLFADTGLADQAREQVGEWIRQGEVFRLFDLFRVELEVTKDGEVEIYASMDAESTGTAVTLKVIFLAHLLRDLFRSRTEVRLLVFVDELDTLDDINQETIRECCRSLGFTLIMASPNPALANRCYFLRPEGKVTYIYPEESLEVVFRDEPGMEDPPAEEVQDADLDQALP